MLNAGVLRDSFARFPVARRETWRHSRNRAHLVDRRRSRFISRRSLDDGAEVYAPRETNITPVANWKRKQEWRCFNGTRLLATAGPGRLRYADILWTRRT